MFNKLFIFAVLCSLAFSLPIDDEPEAQGRSFGKFKKKGGGGGGGYGGGQGGYGGYGGYGYPVPYYQPYYQPYPAYGGYPGYGGYGGYGGYPGYGGYQQGYGGHQGGYGGGVVSGNLASASAGHGSAQTQTGSVGGIFS